jgi:hypothetical protein
MHFRVGLSFEEDGVRVISGSGSYIFGWHVCSGLLIREWR